MVVLTIIIILAVIVLIALGWRKLLQLRLLRRGERITAHGGIARSESVRIGGVPQWILMQGEDVTKPVLLLLHGGPGMPLPGVSSRGLAYCGFPAPNMSELSKHFVVVTWDQRGAGKSYSGGIPAGTINFGQLTADTGELTDWLRKRFGQSKIYLAGSSWGTIIGLKAAAQYPDKYAAYIGMQQILNWTESDRLAYEWVTDQAKQSGNRKAVDELAKVGLPPYPNATWGVLRKWLMKFGGFGAGNDTRMGKIFGKLLKQLLVSPDYTFRELIRMGMGAKATSEQILEEIRLLDLPSEITSIDVPVVFFHGRHDQTQPGSIVARYAERLQAPAGKQLIWLERSGHMYSLSDALFVEDWMIGQVDKEMRSRAGA